MHAKLERGMLVSRTNLDGYFSKLGSLFRWPKKYGNLKQRTLKGILFWRTTRVVNPTKSPLNPIITLNP